MKKNWWYSDAYGVKWPLQLIAYGAVYFVASGLTQIFLGNNLLPLLGGKSSDPGAIELLYNVEDIAGNIFIGMMLIIAYRIMNKKHSVSGMGFTRIRKREAGSLLAGLTIGMVSMSTVIALLIMTGAASIEAAAPDMRILWSFAMLVTVGFFEETLTRGVLQHTLQDHCGTAAAILAPSLFFGLIHIGNPSLSLISMVNIILAGVFLALLTYVTESIYAAIGFHITWNFFQGSIYGAPVSGNMISKSSVFVENGKTGAADWIGGGAFGPEGTVYCTILYLIMIAVLMISAGKRRVLPG